MKNIDIKRSRIIIFLLPKMAYNVLALGEEADLGILN
jgi:hypothetical protein